MDDQFFAKLREIQKKERANSSLARVRSDFYKITHKYLDNIRDIALNDPFSEESDLLKNAQRIATEIYEIREHKITDAAVINIHRSYHLFQGKPQFDLIDTIPLNITEEEEKLYFSFVDALKVHRRVISLDQLNTNDNGIINDSKIEKSSPEINNDKGSQESTSRTDDIFDNDFNQDSKNNKLNQHKFDKNESHKININKNNADKGNDSKNNQVINRLNDIKSAKVIENESYETIEKQISKSKNSFSDNQNKKDHLNSSTLSKSHESTKSEPVKKHNNEANNQINKGFNNRINSEISPKINKTIESSKTGKNKNFELVNIIGNEKEQFVDLDNIDIKTTDTFDSVNFNKINNTRSRVDKIVNTMILIFSDVNSIIGVDKKIYGPFKSQDIVIMPDINANILVKNKKGRLVKI